uniref:Uncharacterized protein n=1 Tax=Opuntia streptacantha TaxID=393608 RepID=A0A7C9CD49_OPUST
MILSLSVSWARRTDASDSRAETRVDRAMDVIFRAMSSWLKGSEGRTPSTSSGRSNSLDVPICSSSSPSPIFCSSFKFCLFLFFPSNLAGIFRVSVLIGVLPQLSSVQSFQWRNTERSK